MRSIRSSRHAQRGVTLTETLLVLGLAAVLAAAAYRAYTTASNDAKNSEQGNGAIALVGKVKQVFGTDGNYEDLTADRLGKSGILPAQFRFAQNTTTPANSQVRDVFGNEILVAGTNNGSFTLQFGLLSKEGCSTLASTLASLAYRINVGDGATGESGEIDPTKGLIYKTPDEVGLNVANLVDSCSSDTTAHRTVVAEIR